MSDEVAALVGMAAALNPLAAALAAGGRVAWRTAAIAAAVAAVVLVAAILLAEPILDALSISPASFRVAAGVVMLVSAAQVTLLARRANPPVTARRFAAYPLAVPALAGPAVVVLGMSISANEGIGIAVAGAAVAVALGVLGMVVGPRVAFGVAARFVAALLIVLGVGEIVDGVKAV